MTDSKCSQVLSEF